MVLSSRLIAFSLVGVASGMIRALRSAESEFFIVVCNIMPSECGYSL